MAERKDDEVEVTPDFDALVAAIVGAVKAAKVNSYRRDNSANPPAFFWHVELDDCEYSGTLTPTRLQAKPDG